MDAKKMQILYTIINQSSKSTYHRDEQALTEQLGEEWLALLPEMLPYISELMEDEDESR
jgi:hypothetical protein